MTEKAMAPRIRFKGFTDPWEQRKLGDLSHRITRKNEDESNLPLTISAQYGLVDQRTFFNNQVASKDMSGYYLLRRGEFAYNKSTSGDSPWGAVKRLEKYEKGCVSTLYICFGLDGADPEFLLTYYETDRWYRAVRSVAAEGARNHGLLNIAPDEFFDTALELPQSTSEQRAIGALFRELDSLITLHQRKYDKLSLMKKALLDKMFPKSGESVPEVRFKGFTDPWEQRKLGDLTREIRRVELESDAPVMMISTPANGFIYQSQHYAFDNTGESLKKYICLHKGEMAYNHGASRLRPYGSSFVLKEEQARVPFVYHCYEVLEDDPDFISLQLNLESMQLQLRKLISSGARMDGLLNISYEEYMSLDLLVPAIEEQRQIGSLFSSLDNLITLHQRELELLRSVKKSLLEGMFV